MPRESNSCFFKLAAHTLSSKCSWLFWIDWCDINKILLQQLLASPRRKCFFTFLTLIKLQQLSICSKKNEGISSRLFHQPSIKLKFDKSKTKSFRALAKFFKFPFFIVKYINLASLLNHILFGVGSMSFYSASSLKYRNTFTWACIQVSTIFINQVFKCWIVHDFKS